jgi:hypothetical protein
LAVFYHARCVELGHNQLFFSGEHDIVWDYVSD